MSDVTEITHDLIKPFKYTPKNAGEEVEAQFISLGEPSVKQLKACSTLKQAFMRAIAEQQEKSGQNEPDQDGVQEIKDETPQAERIINALYSSNIDINIVLLSAKELFKNVGQVDGEKNLTDPMLDSMSIQDIEQMTGKYMENFILASVLEGQ